MKSIILSIDVAIQTKWQFANKQKKLNRKRNKHSKYNTSLKQSPALPSLTQLALSLTHFQLTHASPLIKFYLMHFICLSIVHNRVPQQRKTVFISHNFGV